MSKTECEQVNRILAEMYETAADLYRLGAFDEQRMAEQKLVCGNIVEPNSEHDEAER